MIDQLQIFSEVSRLTLEVGSDPSDKIEALVNVERLSGSWKELATDINTMAVNLNIQMPAFNDITNAVANGDFIELKIIGTPGEIDNSKRKIKEMVLNLKGSIQKNAVAMKATWKAAEPARKNKYDFVTSLSKEILTPMENIISMIRLILDTDLTKQQREILNMLHTVANHLLSTANDILDCSMINPNPMTTEEIPFSLRKEVFNILKPFTVKANEKSLDLICRVDHSVPDYVVGDLFRIKRIIASLVENAIKFTEHGEVSLTIREVKPECSGTNDTVVEFGVSDTGIGIEKDKLNVIFDIFEARNNSLIRKHGGSGLDLFFVKEDVNLIRGNIWAKSQVGKGSTFLFTCTVGLAESDHAVIGKQFEPYSGRDVLVIARNKLTTMEKRSSQCLR